MFGSPLNNLLSCSPVVCYHASFRHALMKQTAARSGRPPHANQAAVAAQVRPDIRMVLGVALS